MKIYHSYILMEINKSYIINLVNLIKNKLHYYLKINMFKKELKLLIDV